MKLENGTLCHDLLAEKMRPELTYDENEDFVGWERKIKEKFTELLGLDGIEENARGTDPQFEIESEEQKDGYRQIRFTFVSEPGKVVPCYLLLPDLKKEKYPVVITLQGHSTGFHNSIGEKRYPEDEKYQPRGAFAVQAVKEGYAALAIQLRAMMGEGESANEPFRRVQLDQRVAHCYYESVTAALMGRTVLGERCFDISRAIDMLSNFKECDTDKIAITGNSGGGTASYYAAAYDKRIKACLPSSSFCPYKESILRFYHCSCNYIPHAYKYFDMQDLACLIAPRPLTIVTGMLDESFLVDGVRRGYETVRKIYEKKNAADNCKLIVTKKGHWWNVDVMWPEVKEIANKLGW